MVSKLATWFILFSGALGAQTLTLLSGNNQLVPAGHGQGSGPITFQLTNGATPVANAVITVTNTNGTDDTGMEYSTLVTNASGEATDYFVPGTLFGDFETYVLNVSAPGSNVLTLYETEAFVPPSTISITQAPANPYSGTAGVPGAPISINIFGGGGIANVSLSLKPVASVNTAPPGTLLQSIGCEVNGQVVSQVLTDVNGNATCVPVFEYANAALNPAYNVFAFQVVVGTTFIYSPFIYNIAQAPPTITAGPVNQIVLAGAPVAAAVTSTGGTPPLTYSIVPGTGNLPSGIVLEANGQFAGAATTPGIYPFEVQVVDGAGRIANSANLHFSFAISAGAFVISPATLPPAAVGSHYSATVSFTGGIPPYTLGTTGTIPGLTFTPGSLGESLTISGVPSTAGSYPISVAGLDALKEPFQIGYTVTVVSLISVATPVIPTAVIGANVSIQLTASGGLAPYTFTETGTLPPGLTLSTAGLLSGVPTVAGVYPITIMVADATGQIGSGNISIPVSGGPLSYPSPEELPAATPGVAYSAQIPLPTGGVPPYRYVLIGTPPAGVSVSSSGLLTGTFTTEGTENLPFEVFDALGETFDGVLQFAVGTATPTVNAVVNSGSSSLGALSPGEIVSIYGLGLGPATGVGGTTANGSVTTTLSGVTVSFGSYAAPILYASQNQVNAVVPFEVAVGETSVTVSYNGVASPAVNVSIQSVSPGIFLLGGTQGAILNSDFSVNGASNPAAPGSFVVIYATGFGAFTPPLTDGLIATAASTTSIPDVVVTIGGVSATVLYAGAAPGIVAGGVQLNVEVPAGVAAGPAVPLVVSVGNTNIGTENVTLSVSQ